MAVDPATYDVSPSTWRWSPSMVKPGMRCCIGPDMWSTVVTAKRIPRTGSVAACYAFTMMPLHPEDTTTFQTEEWPWDRLMLVERK